MKTTILFGLYITHRLQDFSTRMCGPAPARTVYKLTGNSRAWYWKLAPHPKILWWITTIYMALNRQLNFPIVAGLSTITTSHFFMDLNRNTLTVLLTGLDSVLKHRTQTRPHGSTACELIIQALVRLVQVLSAVKNRASVMESLETPSSVFLTTIHFHCLAIHNAECTYLMLSAVLYSILHIFLP